MPGFYRGCDHLKRLQEALGIEGRVKSIKLEMDIAEVATVEVVRFVEVPNLEGLVKELTRYRLEPLESEVLDVSGRPGVG